MSSFSSEMVISRKEERDFLVNFFGKSSTTRAATFWRSTSWRSKLFSFSVGEVN